MSNCKVQRECFTSGFVLLGAAKEINGILEIFKLFSSNKFWEI
jgi:hypothetical protein